MRVEGGIVNVAGASRPVAQVTRRGMRSRAKRRISWARHEGRQVHADHRFHFDDAGGDFDEAQAQGVELGDAPHRTLWHRHAKAPISQ